MFFFRHIFSGVQKLTEPQLWMSRDVYHGFVTMKMEEPSHNTTKGNTKTVLQYLSLIVLFGDVLLKQTEFVWTFKSPKRFPISNQLDNLKLHPSSTWRLRSILS